MIIIGKPTLDLQSSELVESVQNSTTGDSIDVQKVSQNGFHASGMAAFESGTMSQVGKGNLFIPWTVIQEWAIYEPSGRGYQEVQRFTIQTTASRELEAALCIELLIRDGTDPAVTALISKAFSDYQYPGSGDLDTYAEQVLRANPGISPFAFGLAYFYRVKIISDRRVNNSKLELCRREIRENYVLRLISEQDLKSHRPKPQPHNVGEAANSGDLVNRVAEENAPRGDCGRFRTDYHEFHRGDWVPEEREVWGWHRVEIGCVSFDLYYPEFQFRNQKHVASVYWTVPIEMDRYVRKMVEDCANKSAAAAIVVLIVFTDIETAITTFKTLFWKCLREKTDQAIACIDVGIVLNIVPDGDWH